MEEMKVKENCKTCKHLLEHCSEVDILPYCKKINSTILNYLACNYYDRREDERGTERIR
jgi:hypothetical protein